MKGIILAQKDLQSKSNSLGQFFTPKEVVDFCLDHTKVQTRTCIEPSCGQGAFLPALHQMYSEVIAIEVDETLSNSYNVINQNFYDFDQDFKEDITFIGNPPYRTPAYSLSDRRHAVKKLCKEYKIVNMREEAVFFILKTIDLVLKSGVKGHIHYILPKTLFSNNSRAYKSFADAVKKHCRLVSVWDINTFPNVSKDLCYVHFAVGETGNVFFHNGQEKSINDFYGIDIDMIPFQKIFSKTYLGSVPCESLLLSIRGEPLPHFIQRLTSIFSNANNDLISSLTYNGEYHLSSMRNQPDSKIVVIRKYVDEIRELIDPCLFKQEEFYKTIRHRNENRWYFRHEGLKKGKFVYEINKNPCPSFYFPGNPNKGSTDYFGFCPYDVNRNSSPGANRTVPLSIDYITDEFKSYWRENTDLPFDQIFNYIIHVSKGRWYKELKTKYQRFYFGVPTKFDRSFL